MDFNEYQNKSRKTAGYPAIGHPVIYPVLGLANEAGEVAGKRGDSTTAIRRTACVHAPVGLRTLTT